jgi:hypothetical protein
VAATALQCTTRPTVHRLLTALEYGIADPQVGGIRKEPRRDVSCTGKALNLYSEGTGVVTLNEIRLITQLMQVAAAARIMNLRVRQEAGNLFPDYLSDCWFLMKDCASWSGLVS